MIDPPERPPIAAAPISVVLPLYNAEAYLEQAASDWTAHLDGLSRDYELLLVDDGSTDATAERADAQAGRHARVRVLRHPAREGIGAVLRTGLAAATHPLLACTDFGDPYSVAALDRLLEVIDHVDLVSGYRAWEPPALGRPLRWLIRTVFGIEAAPRDFFGRLAWRLPNRALFAVRLTDVTCGFRLYRRTMFERLRIQSNGPFAQVEVLAKANFLGCMMTEVPVHYRPRGPLDSGAELRQILAEARRVFSDPDFGRAATSEEKAPQDNAQPSANP
jgi:dolichol-phosphate mannosyltransferase